LLSMPSQRLSNKQISFGVHFSVCFHFDWLIANFLIPWSPTLVSFTSLDFPLFQSALRKRKAHAQSTTARCENIFRSNWNVRHRNIDALHWRGDSFSACWPIESRGCCRGHTFPSTSKASKICEMACIMK
jgi:hypothetical protein